MDYSINTQEDIPINQLNYIRESIENMNKTNQIEVLRILNNYKEKNDGDIFFNENKYGVHINLSELKKEIIDNLILFIKYVNTREIDLNEVQQQQDSFKNKYFIK